MDCQIYLNGESCGEISKAEIERLAKEIQRDPRVWVSLFSAQAFEIGKFLLLYLRVVIDLSILTALIFAPEIYQILKGTSAEEIALALNTAALLLIVLGIVIVGFRFIFSPKPATASEDGLFAPELLKRVRKLKKIPMNGKMEISVFLQ